MKKMVFVLALMIGVQASAGEIISTIIMAPVISTLTLVKWTQTGSSELKQLAVAAQEDALLFYNSNGEQGRSVILHRSFASLAKASDVSQLTERDMAQAIWLIATDNLPQ